MNGTKKQEKQNQNHSENSIIVLPKSPINVEEDTFLKTTEANVNKEPTFEDILLVLFSLL
jgi:hypothetical protein